MKKRAPIVTLKNFQYIHLGTAPGQEDITEWFSDTDIHLSDIVRERKLIFLP